MDKRKKNEKVHKISNKNVFNTVFVFWICEKIPKYRYKLSTHLVDGTEHQEKTCSHKVTKIETLCSRKS